ncbi:MAG: hypothetical protein AB7E55_09605 [Pigmentiphaga sp.]
MKWIISLAVVPVALFGCAQIETHEERHARLSGEVTGAFVSGAIQPQTLGKFESECQRVARRQCTPADREKVNQELARQAWVRTAPEREAKAVEGAKIKADLESGKRKPQTWEEASVLYQAMPGDGLAMRPLMSGGDGKYYVLQAYITAKQGDSYIFWWADSPLVSRGAYGMQAMGAVFENPAHIDVGVGFNMHVKVVGRYIGNQTIRLVDGASAVVPVFDNAHIFRW